MLRNYFPEGEKKKILCTQKLKYIYIYLFKHPKNLRGLGFGTYFLLLLCNRGRCFYCASGVLYYLEVWTWKVLSALSSHWLQRHPALQPISMGSGGTPHPTADVFPMEHLLQWIPSLGTPGPWLGFGRALRSVLVCWVISIPDSTSTAFH